jgi:hypothetical protein
MNPLPILLFVAAFGAPAQDSRQEQIQKATAEITAITGWTAKRAIPYETLTRDQWRAWVEEQIRENVKPEEIRAEELTLKKFGLIPQDFDLKRATIDLLFEQAAAVYDHHRKKILFPESVPGLEAKAMEDVILVHELSHALADQQFDLRRFLEKSPKTDESQLARLAVVEGQATWIMFEAAMRRMGSTLKGNKTIFDMMANASTKMAAGMFPVFEQSPLYLKETLLFPYSAGLLFQQAALDKYGQQAFAEVLKRPPATTREVLHPEVWFEGVKPDSPALSELEDAGEYRKLNEGTLGELDLRILLTQYGLEEDARRVSAAWRGGRFELLEHNKDGHTVLRWAVQWSGGETAGEFLRLYAKVLAGKWKKCELRAHSGDALEGIGDDGEFAIHRAGALVTGLEGLKRRQH